MGGKAVNESYQAGGAEEEQEEERRMAVRLRSRLMFCHGPRRFSLLAPRDEQGRILAPTQRKTQPLAP